MAELLKHLAAVRKVAGSNPTWAKTVKLSLSTKHLTIVGEGSGSKMIGHRLSHTIAQHTMGP